MLDYYADIVEIVVRVCVLQVQPKSARSGTGAKVAESPAAKRRSTRSASRSPAKRRKGDDAIVVQDSDDEQRGLPAPEPTPAVTRKGRAGLAKSAAPSVVAAAASAKDKAKGKLSKKDEALVNALFDDGGADSVEASGGSGRGSGAGSNEVSTDTHRRWWNELERCCYVRRPRPMAARRRPSPRAKPNLPSE